MKTFLATLLVLLGAGSLNAQDLQTIDASKKRLSDQYNMLRAVLKASDKNLISQKQSTNKSVGESAGFDKERDFIVPAKYDLQLTALQSEYGALQKELYGKDNRKEITDGKPVCNITAQVKEKKAKGVCAIILKTKLAPTADGKAYLIGGGTLRNTPQKNCTQNVCPKISFGDQKNPVSATGFILSSNRILTVNHLFYNDSKVNDYYIVVNYTKDVDQIPAADVFSIKSIVPKNAQDAAKDFKILEVDRAFAPANKPLQVNKNNTLQNKDDLFMIGFPSGLPMKLVDSASVYNINESLFYANLDAFSGNSGSPVFSADGLIEGILKDGAADYGNSGDDCCDIISYSTDISNSLEKERIIRLQFLFKTPSYFN